MVGVAPSPADEATGPKASPGETLVGVRRTEIGLIPEEWEVRSLSALGRVIRGASPRPKGDPRYYDGPVPRLMVEDVTRDGKIVFPSVDSLTIDGAQLSRPCKKGTLTVVCSGTVGVPSILGIDACIHDGFLALVSIKPNADSEFLYYVMQSRQADFDDSATHGGVFTNLTTEIFGDFLIPLPSLAEQEKIAGALSDADAAIRAVERLIGKKRAVKQAAIHALLTPTTRLPGFTEEWETKTLGTNATLKARIGWQGLTTEEYLPIGDFGLVTGTDFDSGRVDWARTVFVEKPRYDQDKYIQLREGDVLITKDGTIGKSAFIAELPRPATLNSGVFVVRPKDRAFDPEFFFHLLTSFVFDEFLNRLSAGSTINHLYQKDFVSFEFPSPPLDEQRAVAAVLSDMDTAIAALEARWEKLKAIKQGMMQALLTGKVRLV